MIMTLKASYFNAEPDMNKLWPMGTIPYMIDGNLGKIFFNRLSEKLSKLLASVKSLIVAAMDQYHQNTCIRFVERSNQYDYIHISKENG